MIIWEGIMEQAKTLQDINFTCGYYVLKDDDLANFYVDTEEARGGSRLKELKVKFAHVHGVYQQVLYLGHVGSGKSTLLYKFAELMKDDYNVVIFSLQDLLNVADPSFSDLLYVLFHMVYSVFINDLNKIDAKILEDVYKRWYATITYEDEEIKALDGQVDTGVDAKLGFLFAKISNSFKMNSEHRRTIKSTVSSNISQYIDSLNKLLDACNNVSKKPLLFIIDDLDKRMTEDTAREIFINRGSLFRDIRLRVVLTAPIILNYIPESTTLLQQNFSSVEKCPMIMVINPDGTKNELGFKTMKEIIYKRVDKSLIDEKWLEKAIAFSGGVLRDLLKIIVDSACLASVAGKSVIEEEHIDEAMRRLQNGYENVFRSSYLEVVQSIYTNPRQPIEDEQVFLKLLSAGIVIEYNGIQWKGIAPAIVNYLKELGLLNATKNQQS